MTEGLVMLSAILAGGKDLIVNFPQQPNWTGSVSEMERVSSASSSSYWYILRHSVCYLFVWLPVLCTLLTTG